MSLSLETVILIGIIFVLIDIVIVIKLFANRLQKLIKDEKTDSNNDLFAESFVNEDSDSEIEKSFDELVNLNESLKMNDSLKSKVVNSMKFKKIEKKYIKNLSSIFWINRVEASVKLGLHNTENSRLALERALSKEKLFHVKLYIANSLGDMKDTRSIPVLVSSLINSHQWYRKKVNSIIVSFGKDFDDYIDKIIHRNETEIKELLVDFASQYPSENTKSFLLNFFNEEEYPDSKEKYAKMDNLGRCCGNCIYGRESNSLGNRICPYNGEVSPFFVCRRFKRLQVSIQGRLYNQKLRQTASLIVSRYYPDQLNDRKFLENEDLEIRKNAIRAIAKLNEKNIFTKLAAYLEEDELTAFIIGIIGEYIDTHPEYFYFLLKNYDSEKNEAIKSKYIEIFANKVEYFFIKMDLYKDVKNRKLILDIVNSNKNARIIDFLNRNKNIDIENEILSIVKEPISKNEIIRTDFSRYLDERILAKLSIERYVESPKEVVFKRDIKKMRNLAITLTFILAIVPIVYVIRHYDQLFITSLYRQAKTYVIDYNIYLVYYSIAINSVYLLLLLLSANNMKKQARLWSIKTKTMLFKKNMLPAISIIAPAYNEEMTIIESITSLLNLKYPEYELIVVNDGSKDNTLNTIIDRFDLKRVDYLIDSKINTKEVRGVYMNRSMPNLIVVDKLNGGKADSLNVGINVSTKEFFCCIDADSLLEDESLLKLASLELDMGVETPALGGNIFAANGCTIDKGVLSNIAIPKKIISRIQTVEYIRAFMTGRLGWANINGLLIISGAFGLFRKERVQDVGGYLTSSGRYAKDTVGEDMELVVRIRRHMEEINQKYKIAYAFNANCWTEVPEEYSALKKQRIRWHNGLIDVMFFHKKMLFNPKHKVSGLVAMPYFLIFEIIGPIFEIQGYIMIVLALLLGLLNVQIMILLFIVTILMGVLISLSSILIAENETKYFNLKEMAILVMFSIMENFGPRQIISFWRTAAYIRLLKKPESWDKIERKGFATAR
ncbi:MAG: glycosyltransferase [Proteocatella sp.]